MAVNAYSGHEFTGTMTAFAGPGAGEQSRKINSITQAVASVKIAPGYTAKLYSGPNMTGSTVTFQGGSQIPLIWEAPVQSMEITGAAASAGLTGKTISGTISTNVKPSTYDRCGHDHCLYGDWRYNRDKCSNKTKPRARCSTLDTTVCPKIGGGPLKIEWANPNANEDPAQTLIKCTYDLSMLKTKSDIDTLINTNWADRSTVIQQWDSILMPNFCGTKVNTCPTDPATGRSMASCSRFVSTGTDGDACLFWVNESRTPGSTYGIGPANSDTAISTYCKNNTTADCACVNRAKDPLYRLFMKNTNDPTAGNVIGDVQCWYKPCMATSDMSTTLGTSGISRPCTTKVCQAFASVSQGTLSTAQNLGFTQQIDCDQKDIYPEGKPVTTTTKPTTAPTTRPTRPSTGTAPSTITPTGTQPGAEPGTGPSGGPLGQPSDQEPIEEPAAEESGGFPTWGWFAIGGIILLILILVIVAIIFMARRKKKS